MVLFMLSFLHRCAVTHKYIVLHMSGKCGIAEIKCVREHDLSFPHGNKFSMLLSMESLST